VAAAANPCVRRSGIAGLEAGEQRDGLGGGAVGFGVIDDQLLAGHRGDSQGRELEFQLANNGVLQPLGQVRLGADVVAGPESPETGRCPGIALRRARPTVGRAGRCRPKRAARRRRWW